MQATPSRHERRRQEALQRAAGKVGARRERGYFKIRYFKGADAEHEARVDDHLKRRGQVRRRCSKPGCPEQFCCLPTDPRTLCLDCQPRTDLPAQGG